MTSWRTPQTNELFRAMLAIRTEDEMAAFCRDLMTEPELKELAGRWQVAKLLAAGKSQRSVSEETGISIATVTRVNQWLRRGMGGYRLLIERLHSHRSDADLSAG